MPEHLDILIERLRGFDEVTILELLDITTEELIERFKDRINARREYLFGEIEEFPTSVDEEFDDEWDGFSLEDDPDYE
jgi:hypothetical protein